MIGYTDAEGILAIILRMRGGVEPVHNDFETLIPLAFDLERGSEKSKQIAQKIKEFYYGEQQPSMETLETFVKVSRNKLIYSEVYR